MPNKPGKKRKLEVETPLPTKKPYKTKSSKSSLTPEDMSAPIETLFSSFNNEETNTNSDLSDDTLPHSLSTSSALTDSIFSSDVENQGANTNSDLSDDTLPACSLDASYPLTDSMYIIDHEIDEEAQPEALIKKFTQNNFKRRFTDSLDDTEVFDLRLAFFSQESAHTPFSESFNKKVRRSNSFTANDLLGLSSSFSSSSELAYSQVSDHETPERVYKEMTKSEKFLADSYVKKTKSIPSIINDAELIQSIQLRLENKAIPHAFTIIEGHLAPKEIIISGNTSKEYKFINSQQFDGENANGVIDHKQSMSAYIRDDYKDFIKAVVLDLEVSESDGKYITNIGFNRDLDKTTPEKSDNIIFKHKCMAFLYQVCGQLYCDLVVHIPNKYADIDIATKAVASIKNELKATYNINMVAYHGDTNFTSIEGGGIAPSTNGRTSTSRVIAPSSGAKQLTRFMQSRPVGQYENVVFNEATLLQPVVTTKNKKGGVGIDHNSYLAWNRLKKPLEKLLTSLSPLPLFYDKMHSKNEKSYNKKLPHP